MTCNICWWVNGPDRLCNDGTCKLTPAQADTRRMAETGTGSGRSPSGTVAEGDAP